MMISPSDLDLEMTDYIDEIARQYMSHKERSIRDLSLFAHGIINQRFLVKRDEAKQLQDFLSHEYISHEHYPLVHDIIKRLRNFIDEK